LGTSHNHSLLKVY